MLNLIYLLLLIARTYLTMQPLNDDKDETGYYQSMANSTAAVAILESLESLTLY